MLPCRSGGQRKRGAEIIAELASAGETRFARLNPQQAASLASVFDQYQQKLVWQKLMDFDDLLHHCLALLHDHPEVSQHCQRRCLPGPPAYYVVHSCAAGAQIAGDNLMAVAPVRGAAMCAGSACHASQ